MPEENTQSEKDKASIRIRHMTQVLELSEHLKTP